MIGNYIYDLYIMSWCYCSGASVKVSFEDATNTIDLSGPAVAVDVAFHYIQSDFISAICHDCLELCLPGNNFPACKLCCYPAVNHSLRVHFSFPIYSVQVNIE